MADTEEPTDDTTPVDPDGNGIAEGTRTVSSRMIDTNDDGEAEVF